MRAPTKASVQTVMILLVAGMLGCGENGGGTDASADAGDVQDASDGGAFDGSVESDGGGPLPVEIGTGVDGFHAMVDGETVDIIQGPQGGGREFGFHIWHAARARGFDPVGVTLRFRTLVAASGEEIATQERVLDLEPAAGGFYVAYGIAPQLSDCCLAEDQDVIMFVEIRDSSGRTAQHQRTVHADLCRDFSGSDICP